MTRSAVSLLAASGVCLCVGAWMLAPAAGVFVFGALLGAVGVLSLDFGGGER